MGIQAKLIAAGLAALALILIIGGFWVNEHLEKRDLQKDLAAAQVRIISLEKDKVDLQLSVNDKDQQINSQHDQLVSAIRDQANQQATVARLSSQIADVERQNNDEQTQRRLANIRKGRQASLFINTVNKDGQCEFLHIEEEGHCVNGEWKSAVIK